MMQISNVGLEDLKEYEGFRADAYRDTGGVWTVGFGTTRLDGRPVRKGDHVTQQKAMECLKLDTSSSQACINEAVKVVLKQQQFDALVSFVYNVGSSAFRSSTLLKKLNLG